MSAWNENGDEVYTVSGDFMQWEQHRWFIVGQCAAIESLVETYSSMAGSAYARGDDKRAEFCRNASKSFEAMAKIKRDDQKEHEKVKPELPIKQELVTMTSNEPIR